MTEKILFNLFEKCEVFFHDELISQDKLLKSYSDFISKIMGNNDLNKGLVLHTGSICFDIITLFYAILSCIYYDQTSPDDIIHDLDKGEKIEFSKGRGIFLGFDEKGWIIIQQENRLYKFGPKNFNQIKPYNGDGAKLDSKGLSGSLESRISFIEDVFNKSRDEISSETRKSVIIIIDRLRADFLIKGIKIKSKNVSKKIELTQLITASYFTEHEEYRYSGNAAKNEPVIKIISKTSIAREMILEDDEQRIIGLMVMGKTVLDNGLSELSGLIGRRSLIFSLISYDITQDDTKGLKGYFEGLSLFACTKKLLKSYFHENGKRYDIMGEYNKRIYNLINRNINEIKIRNDFNWNTSDMKKAIAFIKDFYPDGDEINQFIIFSYSLINLFTTAIFPMETMELLIKENKIRNLSPYNMILDLEKTKAKFTGILYEKMDFITKKLLDIYKLIYHKNKKFDYIIKQLCYSTRNKSWAIVVAKSYYRDIFNELKREKIKVSIDCYIETPSRFDDRREFDEILVVGQRWGKHFNIFKCNASNEFKFIEYDFESKLFNYQLRKNNNLEVHYNKLMGLTSFNEEYEDIEEILSQEIESESVIDTKLQNFVDDLFIDTALKSANKLRDDQKNSILTDIIRIAKCTTGETIFFTEHYIPYLFNKENSIVKESEVKKLSPGDKLIFTRNNNQSQDIVDEILLSMCEAKNEKAKVLEENYEKSIYWKNLLKKYMCDNNKSFSDISESLRSYGLKKHEVTIRSWLNEDAHIVGPRDFKSYAYIAIICNDEQMIKDCKSYYEASNYIRSTRIKILKWIGLSIIQNFSDHDSDTDELFDYVAPKINELSQIVEIENITDVKNIQIVSYMANRPQNL